MPKMPDSELRAILAAAKSDALAGLSAGRLAQERADALSYYLGDVSRDLPAADGRSSAVSMDVADTIEGLMPALMEVFCGSDEVVRFAPVGPEDVTAAEQETDYVNHVFMQQNPGFLVLYSLVKDALLSKVGVAKVFWDRTESEARETYLDQPDQVFALLAGDPEVEVVAHSERADPDYPGQALHDVTIARKRAYACARVEPVPPEEFGIARRARSIKDADYCFHEVVRTQSDLIEAGYDAEQVRGLPSHAGAAAIEAAARDTADEGAEAGDDLNAATRAIRVTEHYIRMDYEGSGKARLYRVTTGGEDVLTRGGEPEIVEEDFIPFAAMTPIIVTHRFFGRSIADLVMDIQRIKTALLRALLDNAYLANNPRVELAESYASDATLDDLLVSRPGGVIRTRMPGGISWQAVPTIGNHVLPLLEYQDVTREWRTGVTRAGQGIDANALQNQTATATNQLYNAAQARMKLIARIFAETGIKDLFALLHATIRKHGKQAQTVRLRNTWVAVDPRNWTSRNDMTINVGLGTGGRSERMAQVLALIGLQKEALAAGLTNLVSVENLYNSAKELARVLELKNVDLFFSNPAGKTVGDQQNPLLLQAKAQADLQTLQAQAGIALQGQKADAELALQERKFQLDSQLKLLEHQLKAEDRKTAAFAKLVSEAAPADGASSEAGGPGASAALLAELLQTLRAFNAPKRVVRDEQGRVVGVEPVTAP
jgi:hypothetical protein